jgi:hypothetical protein
VPLERLSDKNVSIALAKLLLALGGENIDIHQLDVNALDATKEPTPIKRGRKKGPKPIAEQEKADLSDRPSIEISDEEFLSQLPPKNQKFARFFAGKKKITMEDAFEFINTTNTKVVGGTVGAILRFAEKNGYLSPYSGHFTEDGLRYWIWEGARKFVDTEKLETAQTQKKQQPKKKKTGIVPSVLEATPKDDWEEIQEAPAEHSPKVRINVGDFGAIGYRKKQKKTRAK